MSDEAYQIVDCKCRTWCDANMLDRLEHGGHHKTCDVELVVGDGLRVFHIDEGVDHWVIAKDEADAKALVLETDGVNEADHGWITHPPTIAAMTIARAEKIRFHEDDGTSVPLRAEAERIPVRRYVACSEY